VIAPSVVVRIKISDNADTLIRSWWLARFRVLKAEADSIRKGRDVKDMTREQFDTYADAVHRGSMLMDEYQAFCRDFQGDESLDICQSCGNGGGS